MHLDFLIRNSMKLFFIRCVFLVSAFYVHIGTYITQTMLTAMTSLYVAPCESSPPVFLYTLCDMCCVPSDSYVMCRANGVSRIEQNKRRPKLRLDKTKFTIRLTDYQEAALLT